MKQSDIKVGTVLIHKFIGEVVYTDSCQHLQEMDAAPDALYVEHNGEIKEVTFSLLKIKE